jgi:hypothetical protein
MSGPNIAIGFAALVLISSCAHAASRPEVASDDAAASQALMQLRPPGGFTTRPCATHPAVCFVSDTLIDPATTAGAASILTAFGARVNPEHINCTPAGIYTDAYGKDKSIQCEAVGAVDRYMLAITVSSLARAPRAPGAVTKQTTVSFTAVRVLI